MPSMPIAAGQDSRTLSDVARIVAELFKYPVEQIAPETVAADVPGWGSLMHATLILEIEEALDIKFSDSEIFSFTSVGDLVVRAHALRLAKVKPDRRISRVAYEDENVSIICVGEAGDGPDLIVFAG